MSALLEDHEKLLAQGYDKWYNLVFCWLRLARSLKGWDVNKIYDDIKRIDFPHPQHLLDKISDLKAKQEESDSNVIRPLMLLKSLPSCLKGNKS